MKPLTVYEMNLIWLTFGELKILLKKGFTWRQNSPMILCRLDYWLISNNLQDSVSVTNIIPVIKTDHEAISLDFNISELGENELFSSV